MRIKNIIDTIYHRLFVVRSIIAPSLFALSYSNRIITDQHESNRKLKQNMPTDRFVEDSLISIIICETFKNTDSIYVPSLSRRRIGPAVSLPAFAPSSRAAICPFGEAYVPRDGEGRRLSPPHNGPREARNAPGSRFIILW